MARFKQTDKVRLLGKQTNNDHIVWMNDREMSFTPRKISKFATKSPLMMNATKLSFFTKELIINLNSIDKSILIQSTRVNIIRQQVYYF